MWSGFLGPDEMARLTEAGVVHFLPKPSKNWAKDIAAALAP